jgi:Protein of unknown function (DUF4232)
MIAPPKPPPSHDELEALIKEARARQLRRRLFGAAGVAIAAASGLVVYAFAIGGTQPTNTASGGRPLTAAAPCGVAAGWRLRLDPRGWSEPTGQHTAPVVLTRVGAQPCTLDGYPTVTFLDARGRGLDFRYSHRGDEVVTSHSPRTVRVGGHGSAFFLLNKYRCDLHAVGVASRLRVGLPGVRGRLVVPLTYPTMDYCPADAPSRTIAVSPIVAKLRQAASSPG